MHSAGVGQDDVIPAQLSCSTHTDKGRQRLLPSPAAEGTAKPLGVGCLQRMSVQWGVASYSVGELAAIAALTDPKSGLCTLSLHAPNSLESLFPFDT